jgi:hypothetical protein
MNIYYIIGRLPPQPKPFESPHGLETRVEYNSPQTLTSSPQRITNYRAPVVEDSIPRKKIEPARLYTRVKKLEKIKRLHHDRRTRTVINSQIRFKRDQPILAPKQNRYEIDDLLGNQIGIFYRGNNPNNPDHLNLGSEEYVSSFSFKVSATKNGEYCLRTTAYLTERGKDALKGYIKKQLKRREQRKQTIGGKNSKLWVKNSRIKRKIRRVDTFDVVIEGLNIHLDKKGKIEIMYQCPGLDSLLQNGEELSEKQEGRLKYFTRYALTKKWIYETTNDFNRFTGEKLEELSVAVNEILKENIPCHI